VIELHKGMYKGHERGLCTFHIFRFQIAMKMMYRSLSILFGLTIAVGLFAQETPTNIIKSEPKEMTNLAPNESVIDGSAKVGVVIVGDHDIAPTAESCVGKDGDVRSDCMYHQVLAAIRAKMGNQDPNDGAVAYPVAISFVVNQFGDLKNIRVDHTGSADLSNKVITALYDLPKFAPATKAGTSVGSTVTLTYPYQSLFATDK